MGEIRITLETLYDILRNEKKRDDLQKLEDSFFVDVVSYLREKKSLIDQKKDENEVFAAGEKAKLEYELRSIQRILKQIYELREKKILDIALNRSRTGSNIIDTSSMMREEKSFYEIILKYLDEYRWGILFKLFKGDLPEIRIVSPSPESIELNRTLTSSLSTQEPYEEDENEDLLPPESQNPIPSPLPSSSPSAPLPLLHLTKIKFIQPVPSFVWKDLKVYGPFEPGESTEIFPEVAELLVRKGRAEKWSENI